MKSFTLCSLLLLLVSTFSVNAQPTSVFVTAHPDDWQLFMNPNAYHAAADSNHSLIFIHITAGDAGHGMEYNQYTLAREEGSKRALRFLVKAAFPWENFQEKPIDSVLVTNGFTVNSYHYRNITAYFLRLPDGNYDGNGYERHDYESVRKILSGEKLTINTVDKANTYNLEQLKSTISALIPDPSFQHPLYIHVAETDSVKNPEDHSDHINSSKLIQKVMESKKPYTLFRYIEYHTNNLPMNVFPRDYQLSVGTWGATISGISDFGHYSTWDDTHNSWLGRQYYSETQISDSSNE